MSDPLHTRQSKSGPLEVIEALQPPEMIWDARWDGKKKAEILTYAEAHAAAARIAMEQMSRMLTTAISTHARAVSWAETCRAFSDREESA